jgi:hypothetical protein
MRCPGRCLTLPSHQMLYRCESSPRDRATADVTHEVSEADASVVRGRSALVLHAASG